MSDEQAEELADYGLEAVRQTNRTRAATMLKAARRLGVTMAEICAAAQADTVTRRAT
jgi:hypothetical protein